MALRLSLLISTLSGWIETPSGSPWTIFLGTPIQRAKAKILAAVGLRGQVAFDWQEVRRLADLPQYRILPQCRELVRQVADELETENPFDSAG